MMDKTLKLVLMVFMMSNISAELLRPPQPPHHNYVFNKFRPPSPTVEPTFIQRITSWFFPWGGVSSEEEFRVPAASPKVDMPSVPTIPRPLHFQHSPVSRIGPPQVRDTEPTTARTTPSSPVTKCSPCNKVPWIPMMPTYQLPLVNSGGQQQVYFKHHFGNENQYAQVPDGYKYAPPTTTTQTLSIPPIKFQDGSFNNQGHQYYGVPPIKKIQFEGYHAQSSGYPKATTYKPNTNTIDTSVITFTTGRPQNNRPSRFTAAGPVTNPEYLLPPNVLPLEGENSQIAPIPIPNLSPTPIPPLFDPQNFHHDPYRSHTGFIKLVALEPVAQLSNNVNVQVKPDRQRQEFASIEKNPAVEVINSNLVAEFTIPGTVYNDITLRPRTHSTTHHPLRQNVGFDLDVGNNLDANTTINSPIVVESLETVTDNFGAGSEHDYKHNVLQTLESPVNNLEDIDDDDAISAEESNRVIPFHDYEYNSNFEEQTTTEGSYIVKFEPSVQTAADLAIKFPKNKSESLTKNRDRMTPLELLDSPIFHVTPFTFKPKIATEPPPPFKPIEEFTKKLATLWTLPIPISIKPTPKPIFKMTQTTSAFTSTSVQETTTSEPSSTTKSSFLLKLSGITPPKEPTPIKLAPSTKKPKQIQIVVPYTTYHKPSPFKVQEEQEILTYRPLIRGHYVTHPTRKIEQNGVKNLKIEESFNGHGYHNDQEYPDHAQESKIVESKVTIEPSRTTKFLTKILANNIRDLLKKEKTPKPHKVDLIRLQKNIDGWTEQSFLGKASTIALTGHTKAIPRSFLSSTIKVTTMMKLPTTTLSPKSTFETDLMEETKRQYDNILYKKENDLMFVKRHDRFLDRDNELVLINNNLTYNLHQEGVEVFAPKTTLTPKELWKRLHLTISPITNEKIYVVTPQPHKSEERMSTFRPRFAVRPTVAGL